MHECTSVCLQVAVCTSVFRVCASTRLFTSLLVSGSCSCSERAKLPHLHSPRHEATETLPEIFNSAAAVNSTATLESMSQAAQRGRETKKRWADGLGEGTSCGATDGENERKNKWRGSGGAMEINGGWSKKRASHKCACVSNHVLHILYPAADGPSPRKRDRRACTLGRDGGKEEEEEERGGGGGEERKSVSEREEGGRGEYC